MTEMARRMDAHCHFWKTERGDYGWLDPANPALAPIFRDFAPDDMLPLNEAAGISGVVTVQAAPTVAESRYLLSLAEATPLIKGVVGWVDLSRAEAVEDIHELAAHQAFKGVRPMLQDIEDINWLSTAPRPEVIAALKETGLRFDALVLPQHLEVLLEFALKHPDLPIVIDHAAKPALAAGPDDPRHDMWQCGMKRLAEETGAFCKISGLLTEMAPAQISEADAILHPYIDNLLEWFGPERLMWGSDWPVLTLAAPHADWNSLSARLLADLEEADLARIHAGTAAKFYGLEGV